MHKMFSPICDRGIVILISELCLSFADPISEKSDGYAGCYRDTSDRDMTLASIRMYKPISDISWCIKWCRDQGYSYAGIEVNVCEVCMYVCMCVCVPMYMHICMHVDVWIGMGMAVYICMAIYEQMSTLII